MKRNNSVPINPIEKYLHNISLYQLFVFFVVFLSKIPIIWHILNLIFLSPPMDFYCNGKKGDGRSNKNKCPCESPSWDRSVFTETMQTKFGVLCESQWLVSFSQSMAYAGALVGCLICGFLADKFGRVTIFSFSCLILSISGCLVTVMPSAPAFSCMRFIEGIAIGGTIVTSYVLCVEYCGIRHREVVTALFHIPLNVGHAMLPGISYAIRDFDDFQLAISIPVFLFVPCYWILSEPPKWLLDEGRIDEVSNLLERMRHSNSNSDIKEEIETYLQVSRKDTHTKIKFWEIFKHKKLTINLLCMAVIYFVCGMGYYGVSQFIGEMSGNIHLNVLISGLTLLPGIILCVFLLKLLPRRIFLMITNIGAGVFMLAAVFSPSNLLYLRVVFASISNCCFFVSFIIAFLYGVELFPTAVRNSVLGVLSVLARVGQIINPPLNTLPEVVTGSFYGVMAILGGLLCIVLPETKNTELPSTLEDSQHIAKGHRESETAGIALAPEG